MAPGFYKTRRLRKEYREHLKEMRSEMISRNNQDLRTTREERRAREKAEWLDPRNK